MKGLRKTKSIVRTLTAPIMALMKVLPMMTHSKVMTLIPSNTLKSSSLLARIQEILSWRANPFCHPFLYLLSEATATMSPKMSSMAKVR